MTEAEAQSSLHRLYEGDNQVPSTTDEDYLVRRSYLNDAIRQWEQQGMWRSLIGTLTSASDGTKTTTSGTSTYSAPTDFKRPVGFLRITDSEGSETYYENLPIEKVQLFDNDTTSRFYYITGNDQDGYTINIHGTPTTTGLTINYEYYKHADTLTATTDKFEMSDPYYAIYYALAQLFAGDGQGDRSTLALVEANDKLKVMKRNNMVAGFFQDNYVPDSYFELGGKGFGY